MRSSTISEVRFPSDHRRLARALDGLAAGFGPTTRKAAQRAGLAWRAYRSAGGPRTRVAADFLIGAHATEQADRLLTRDRGFYRRYFDDLRVLDPTP